MALTDTAVRNAKPKPNQYKLADGQGMYLLVHPNGGRYWRFDYRFAGKRKSLALGTYPDLSLLQARRARDSARELLEAGKDPCLEKQIGKLKARIAAENTFQAVGEEFLEKLRREDRAASTLKKMEWLLAQANTVIGPRPITSIEAPEVLLILRKAESRGRRETARRLRSTIGAVFRYAIATARATNDPTYALQGAIARPIVSHRSAITDPARFGALLRAIDGFDGQVTTRSALKLMALLFPRPGELRAAEWNEFDLDRAEWVIPATRTKMRRPHRVPLPQQALAILQEMHEITGDGKLVFPGLRTPFRCISENTMNAALRRLGYAPGVKLWS
jgi:integrase